MIVMSYAKEGSLRKCLSNLVNLKWQYKLLLLKNIILGLKVIHESDLIHCDLHDGNILISDNYETYIIDLGLCKSIYNKIDKIYGIIPYMSPELLRNNPYTPASDIYSFSMIMWELTSGIPPFKNKAHDYELILSICEGERPEIIKNTPKCYIDLMEKCWDADPFKRPTITMLENIISQWFRYVNEYYESSEERNGIIIEFSSIDNQLRNDVHEFVAMNKALAQEQANTSVIQLHSQSYYTSSRSLTKISDQKNSDCLDCIIEN
ncbi:kinase-like domain-containing protein [Glomus cerebriforme]|uniref:Kinase-like domain-containing protein n=1 Tax=Glomus cerebriforme TaxID=658196 RepID=A0A397S108_9GLOM|nr:kinase-like domain-containing protein [Glomus cerebriforme]